MRWPDTSFLLTLSYFLADVQGVRSGIPQSFLLGAYQHSSPKTECSKVHRISTHIRPSNPDNSRSAHSWEVDMIFGQLKGQR